MVSLEAKVVHLKHRYDHLRKRFSEFGDKFIRGDYTDENQCAQLQNLRALDNAYLSVVHNLYEKFEVYDAFFRLPTNRPICRRDLFGNGLHAMFLKENMLSSLSQECDDIKSKAEYLWKLQQMHHTLQHLQVRSKDYLATVTDNSLKERIIDLRRRVKQQRLQIRRCLNSELEHKFICLRMVNVTFADGVKAEWDDICSSIARREQHAATAIICWWRRRQLELHHFLPHRAARVIQRQLRSYVSLKQNNAATKIQLWRRKIVRQRKERRLAAAAQSNPFRDRGLKLTKRNRSTRRRHKRLEQRQKRKVKGNKSALQDTSESSCRGSVLGKTLHNNQRGSSSRDSVLESSQQHRSRNTNVDSAPISDDEIVESLHSSGSGLSSGESVLGKSLPPELEASSSSKAKSRRRRRRSHRRRRRRHRRNLNKCILRNKDVAPASRNGPTPNHLVSQPDLLPMSTFCDRMRKQYQLATPSDRNVLLKSMCQLVIKSIDALSIEPPAIDKLTQLSIPPVVEVSSTLSTTHRPSTDDETHSISSDQRSSSELNQSPPPTTLDELQAQSSIKLDILSPSSNASSIVNQPCLTPPITEETTTRRNMQKSYLQALIGNT